MNETLDKLKEELECLMAGTLKYPDNDYDDAICSAVKLIEAYRPALEAGLKGTLKIELQYAEKWGSHEPICNAMICSVDGKDLWPVITIEDNGKDDEKQRIKEFLAHYDLTPEFNDERSR